ncbi:MAG TPA: membrane dipeptidase, partial [Pseudogracilibacillus sp.]|nr:membrane dipeptidase [Pseudogracilibacillus sp.]
LASDEIGAILTLEGAEPIGNELQKLHQLFKRGIMSVGLTWNQANLCADGVGEPRGAGLSLLGEEVVKLNNKHNVLTDVSHLSVNGFWDVMEQADFPFASHSNSKTICDHPRNLNDDQLKALIKKEAQIHLVFNPPFIKEDRKVTIDDLIKHIDYICSIGGVNNIGFGSDFDGIDEYVVGLEDASKYQELIEELLKHFSESQVRGFAYENFLNYLTHLELN